MSRAFVKETEADTGVLLTDRPISEAPNLVTRRGASLIELEVSRLEDRLSRQDLPASEPALRRDLRYWLARRATMQITEADDPASTAMFGTEVTIERRGRKVTLSIVGEDEADPANGRIAWTAPLAQALLGGAVGETAEFENGDAEEEIAIVAVKRLSESP